jgi:Holliday junction resolvase RusA-like endonuclease
VNGTETTALTVAGADVAFSFIIPGQLRSKSNFRRSGRSGEWSSIRRFEDEVALLARLARPAQWRVGDPDVPVAQRPAVVVVIWSRTLIDAGNLSKSLQDAVEGIVYVTDASVRAVVEVSERARSDQRTVVGFAQLPPAATSLEVTEVAGRLARAVVADAAP